MYKSKLVEIFSSLSNIEQNRLKKFVYSPYHNKHEEVHRLYEYLLDSPRYQLKTAFEAIFPQQEFKPQKVRNTMSYLQKLIDKFLVYEAIEEDENLHSKLLLKAYRKRKLDKCFKSTFKYSNTLQEKSKHKAADYYYLNYELQQEQFLFANQKNRLASKNVQEVLDSFDVFYITNKLKYCVTALTHQNIFSTTYQLHLVAPIIDHIEQNRLLDYPAIAAYYYSYQALIDTKNTTAFFQLKELLLLENEVFKKEELKELYILAINFCIKHLNMGDEGFTVEIYDLYKSGLLSEIFIEDGQISRFTYKNIVATGLKSKDFAWVKAFIEDYAPYLDNQYRKSYFDYNIAKWHYSQKDYKKAMQIFLVLDNTDRIVVMDSKVTLLKIYYELEEYDALDSLLDSFKVYIKRSKDLSAYLKKSYLNLIKYLQKVLNLNFHSKKAKQKLLVAIQQEQQLPERNWILSLIDN